MKTESANLGLRSLRLLRGGRAGLAVTAYQVIDLALTVRNAIFLLPLAV